MIPAHQQLVSLLAQMPDCVVAFSGGVDSAVVAKAAYLALGERAIAVTGVSASLAAGELETAQRIAKSIGIQHEFVQTDELSQPGYTFRVRNHRKAKGADQGPCCQIPQDWTGSHPLEQRHDQHRGNQKNHYLPQIGNDLYMSSTRFHQLYLHHYRVLRACHAHLSSI